MKTLRTYCCLMLCGLMTVTAVSAGEWTLLTKGWLFHKGACPNAQAPGFDDAAWQPVTIPHDWAITGPFNEKENGNTGKLPWRGEGWYRKALFLPADAADKTVYLKFDGVMASPSVYVNGQLAGTWDYGYSTFYLDISAHVKAGTNNVIAVHVNTTNHDSRWYPGAGIYRKVTLMVTDKVHEVVWGTYVTTPHVGTSYAQVRALSTIRNNHQVDKSVVVQSKLINPAGRVVQVATTRASKLAPSSEHEFANWMTVAATSQGLTSTTTTLRSTL